MANKPTDEPIPEELDSDAAEESIDDRTFESDAPEEAKGQSKAEEGQDGCSRQRCPGRNKRRAHQGQRPASAHRCRDGKRATMRAQRDVENAHKFAVEKLLSDLLPVVDSLEKAEEAAKTTDNADSMAEGIKLFSLKLFVSTLEKSGIAIVDPLGDPLIRNCMKLWRWCPTRMRNQIR